MSRDAKKLFAAEFATYTPQINLGSRYLLDVGTQCWGLGEASLLEYMVYDTNMPSWCDSGEG